jgi:MFS family permease
MTKPTRPASWRRDFRWYWTGYSVSRIGDFSTEVVLPLVAYAETHSPVAVGVVAAMAPITAITFGLGAGELADRADHRRILLTTDAIRLVTMAAIAAAVAGGTGGIVALSIAALILGGATIVHDATEVPALTLVVPHDGLVAANARFVGSDAAANVGGPPLGGALVSLGTPAAALAFDAASFALSFATTTRVDALRRPARTVNTADATDRQRLGDGFRALRANKLVWRAALLVATTNVVAVGLNAQFVPYARQTLHMGALGVGVFWSLAGAVTAATLTVVGRSKRVRPDLIAACTGLYSLGVLVAGLWPSLYTAAGAFVFTGIGLAVGLTHWSALRQQQFPTEMLGRVTMASRIVLTAGMAVAMVGGGFVSKALGPPALFVALGVFGLAALALIGPKLLQAQQQPS